LTNILLSGRIKVAKEKQETIEVRVKDRVLWIGSDAYPVSNISRTQARELTFKRRPAWGKFFKSIFGWLAVAVVASIAVAYLHTRPALGLIWLVMLVIFIIDVIRLVVNLSKKDEVFYALVIETSGASQTPLVTRNKAIIYEIIDNVMRAINGEAVRFIQQVSVMTGNQYNFSDNSVGQFGGRGNVGRIGG
jgi:Family of unknown function (DUF6232)